jgi:hypothetical protein
MIKFWRHSGESRNPDTASASAGGKYGWIPAFAGMTLLLSALPPNVYAADDLSSTIRTAPAPADISSTKRTTVPTGISSTVRTKPLPNSSVDPMLDTTASSPPDAITTDDMTSSDPALSTTQSAPTGASELAQPETAKKKSKPTIDPRACEMLTKHTPRADVAAQPGMDANGKAVAPADLAGSPQMQLPTKFDIPLTVNLAKQLNLNTSTAPYNTLGEGTEAWLGTISVEGDKATFNGKPLTDQQQDNLAVLCMHKN